MEVINKTFNPTAMKTEKEIRERNTRLVNEDKEGRYSLLSVMLDLSRSGLIEYLTILDMHTIHGEQQEPPEGLFSEPIKTWEQLRIDTQKNLEQKVGEEIKRSFL